MKPVHDAARANDVEELRRLLDEDPGQLEAETSSRFAARRPIHFACEWGSVEAAHLLLDRGADINSQDSYLETPLMLAASRGRAEVVALLLARGVDPTMTSLRARRTALMTASFNWEGDDDGSDHVAVIRLLLKDGRVPVNARNAYGGTALWEACSAEYTERARVLLLQGRAAYTIAHNNGMTPRATAVGAQLLEWYEGELERAFLLSKARAVADAVETISQAREEVGAKTEAEAQRAREEAAPAYLRGRVGRCEALPLVEVAAEQKRKRGREWEQEQQQQQQWTLVNAARKIWQTVGQAVRWGGGEEDECRDVCDYVVRKLNQDLYTELMEGLRLR